MTFRRTASGLSSLFMFHKVEIVVFVEGATSYSKEEITNGSFSDVSPDIRFWQMIFKNYRPRKAYKFKAAGSKENLKSIANDISIGKVKNTIVAMDRDFDNIYSNLLKSDNVIYTKGYSWENDAWNAIAVRNAFSVAVGFSQGYLGKEINYIENAFERASDCLHWAVLADAMLSQFSCSLFDRKKPQKYITVKNSGEPMINRVQLKKSIRSARCKLKRPIVSKKKIVVNTLNDCFGHLIGEFGYRLLCYLIKKKTKLPTIPKVYAISMVVEKIGLLKNDKNMKSLKKHYTAEFKKVA